MRAKRVDYSENPSTISHQTLEQFCVEPQTTKTTAYVSSKPAAKKRLRVVKRWKKLVSKMIAAKQQKRDIE